MKQFIIVIGLLVMCSHASSANFFSEDSTIMSLDTVDVKTQKAFLSVHSRTSAVKVFIDAILVGVTPLEDVMLDTGTHILRFVHSDEPNWLMPSIIETIMVHTSENIERTAHFPLVYHITSTPYGADVCYNDSLVGQTPFILTTLSAQGLVALTKEGYDRVELPLPLDGGIVHSFLQLQSYNSVSPLAERREVKNLTPVYITSGTAVLGGAVAAYFKIKADNYYNDYRNTGNQAALDRVKRFDTISGVALVTSEVSLFLLSYFLLSQ